MPIFCRAACHSHSREWEHKQTEKKVEPHGQFDNPASSSPHHGPRKHREDHHHQFGWTKKGNGRKHESTFIEPRGRVPTRIGDQEDGEGEESKSEAISEGGGGLGGGEEEEGGLGLGF